MKIEDMQIAVVMPVLIEQDWQIPMTRCAIDTLFCTTKVPFQLIVVETETKYFISAGQRAGQGCDFWNLHIDERGNATRDINEGIDFAQSENLTHTIYTGNDIFVRPGWLEAHLQCWQIPDCGASTLASSDMKHQQHDLISEGVFGPHFMFESHMRFDEENFPATFADTDMVMRLYKDGKRKYRNWNVVIQHLLRQTTGSGKDHEKGFLEARERFIQKHTGCPLWMYQALVQGIGI